MHVLGVIMARAGSKGLPDKCVRELLGRPVIDYTFDNALASERLSAIVFSSDSAPAKAIARARGIAVIDRPAELATDTATVDAVARHAVEWWERRHFNPPLSPLCKGKGTTLSLEHGSRTSREGGDAPLPDGRGSDELGPCRSASVPQCLPRDPASLVGANESARTTGLARAEARGSQRRIDMVVLLYGNIPVRADGLIDRAVEHLLRTGADSVRSVAPVTKQHPDWVHRLDGDRMVQFRPNSIYRRQDLEPLYYHDGAVAVVTREALFGALHTPDDHQSFLGRDRRAIVCHPEDAVDIDGPVDLCLAEAILRSREQPAPSPRPSPWKGEGEAYQSRDRKGAELVPKKGTEARSHEGGMSVPRAPASRSSVPQAPASGVGSRKGREGTKKNADASRSGIVDWGVSIGDRQIGAGQAVFVIAEAGVNHSGDVDTALRMVDAAASAGADAIKFQMFRANDLTTATAPMAQYQRSAQEIASHHPLTLPSPPMGERGTAARSKPASQRDMLAQLELSFDEFARIRRHCDELGIVFLATPFGISEVEQLVTLKAPAIKIASTDLTNRTLLSATAAKGLPLIVSTGAATADEIETSVAFLKEAGVADRLILLHCVSRYPTPMEALNLGAIRSLASKFDLPIGLSDHTTSTTTGGLAVAAGACALEKHFTLDREASGPDHAMSLTPNELADYVAAAREAQSALGSGVIGMNKCEREVREVARRSVVAAVRIANGTTIERSMLTCKRPGMGIPATQIDELVGRTAIADLAADTLLSWDVVR